MILLMMTLLSQVGQGPNNTHRGTPCNLVKTWIISLTASTNDLSFAKRDPLSRIPLTLIIAFKPCQELKNFPSGVLDVGYVYHSKNQRKICSSLLGGP